MASQGRKTVPQFCTMCLATLSVTNYLGGESRSLHIGSEEINEDIYACKTNIDRMKSILARHCLFSLY